jgi:hypothetical protein
VPALTLLREALDRALDCARAISELSARLPNNPDFYKDELRRQQCNLSFFNGQAVESICGDDRLKAEQSNAYSRRRRTSGGRPFFRLLHD